MQSWFDLVDIDSRILPAQFVLRWDKDMPLYTSPSAWIAGRLAWMQEVGQRMEQLSNPGYTDVFKLAIPGTGYPLPGGYDGIYV
jgi:hypothetical protein